MGRFDFFLKQAGLHKLGSRKAYNEEFSTEIHDKTFNTSSMPAYNPYSTSGVHLEKFADHVKVVYYGLLAKNGARHVYAAVGYGDNNNWSDTRYYPMQNMGHQSFELLLPAIDNRPMNLAFKDCANNWDNNSGTNYTFNQSFYGGSH